MRKTCKDNPNLGLSFLYNTYIGRIILKPLVKNKKVSVLMGKFMDSKMSTILIKSFIKKNNIDMNEYEQKKYSSFNDFFVRKIRSEKRPFSKAKSDLIAPADSKLTCYKISDNTTFTIKNTKYNVATLINDKELAKEFKNGYALVFRLSPEDYHHYIFCDDGRILNSYKITGKYHSVNPVAYENFKVFKENTRECTLIKSKNFGDIMYVEVGALLVGKIKNILTKGAFKKGAEKGYFMYGGSTVVLLVKENMIRVDKEILDNSNQNIETYVKCGEKFAEKIN